MADALCGPSNALQNFQKHTSVDRTLQQDRLALERSREDSQGFRSHPGPSAGALDAEYEAFQRGQPAPDHFFGGQILPPPHFHPPSSAYEPLPAWASDFQSLHLNSQTFSPSRETQQPASKALRTHPTSSWQQEFMREVNAPTAPQTQALSPNAHYQSSSWNLPMHPQQFRSQNLPLYDHEGAQNHLSQTTGTFPNRAQDANAQFDREFALFEQEAERHTQAYRDEGQAMTDEAVKDVQRDRLEPEISLAEKSPESQSADLNASTTLLNERIGSDRILDEAQERGEEAHHPNDNDELAKVAGDLLDRVKDERSQKFGQSNFLALMRQLRDREKQVEGDKIVDVHHSLHPGGEHYPSAGP